MEKREILMLNSNLTEKKGEVINERSFIIVTSECCFANGKEAEQSRPWNVLHRMKSTA